MNPRKCPTNISSEYTEGGLPRNISMEFPMVQSSEVPTKCSSEFSSGISEERGPRKFSENSKKHSLGFFFKIPTTYSEEKVVGNFRGCFSSEFRKYKIKIKTENILDNSKFYK